MFVFLCCLPPNATHRHTDTDTVNRHKDTPPAPQGLPWSTRHVRGTGRRGNTRTRPAPGSRRKALCGGGQRAEAQHARSSYCSRLAAQWPRWATATEITQHCQPKKAHTQTKHFEDGCQTNTHTHTCARARTRTHTRARTSTHTHTRTHTHLSKNIYLDE